MKTKKLTGNKKSIEIRAGELRAKIEAGKAELAEIKATLQRCKLAEITIAEVIQKAKEGDELSLALVTLLAGDLVGALSHVARKEPERLWQYTRNLYVWPGYMSRKRAQKRSNEELMDALKLGEGGMFSEGAWQPGAPSTSTAILMLSHARMFKEQWGLGRLTKATKREWFEASWRFILRIGVVPEESTRLAPLGKSAIGKKSTSRGMSEQTEGMRPHDVRAEIKRQLWRAFDELVSEEYVKPTATGNASS